MRKITIKVDLAGCKVAFLALVDKNADGLIGEAIDAVRGKGIKVITTDINKASHQLAKIQQRHGNVPAGQIFLKLTKEGNIDQLFAA